MTYTFSKTLLAVGLMTFSANAAEIKSGSYAGANVGFGQFKNNTGESFFFNNAAGGPFVPGSDLSVGNTATPIETSQSKSGVNFSVFVGYKEVLPNNFVLGLDIAVSKNSGTHSQISTLNTATGLFGNAASESVTTLKHKFSVTPALVVGYKVMPELMIGAKVGAHIARFDVNNTFDLKETNATAVDSSRKFTKTGFEFGVVGEYAVSNNISVMTDVSYTYFSKSTVNFANPTNGRVGSPILADATHSATFKPSFFTAKIGAAYRF